jgi:hypothetical protein
VFVNAIASGGLSCCTEFGVITQALPEVVVDAGTNEDVWDADDVVGAAIVPASGAANLMTGPVVIVDGGFLASRAIRGAHFPKERAPDWTPLENVNESNPAR